MNQDYWQQQTDEALFPNLIWSRPETSFGAGKLLIIGGQAQEFIHVAGSYAAAEQGGIGSVRTLMPDSTSKITKMLPNIEYAASNASGSFARNAYAELVDASLWSDGVLLAGDLGKNSETSLMLEKFVAECPAALTISAQALPSVTFSAEQLFSKPHLLALGLFDLQRLGIELKLEKPITSTIGNVELAAVLHELTTKYPIKLAVEQGKTLWTSVNGRVVSTQNKQKKDPVTFAAHLAVWTIQQPAKLYEAMATAAYC